MVGYVNREVAHSKKAYPPPPWRLCGRAVFCPRVLDIERVRAFVPPPLSIVPILPGQTLGGLYLASYQAGATLTYHELIVIPALVRHRFWAGAWVSHIYVDDDRSVDGGRAIWGLPKEQATFTGAEAAPVAEVHREAQCLCLLQCGPSCSLGRWPLVAPVLSGKGGPGRQEELLWFHAAGSARVHVGHVELVVPRTSPFHVLALGGGPAVHLDPLDVTVHAPRRLAPA